ncbi:hypothetical protein Dole_0950 [Desulfosudis oleivorans Hxd3]|uniref:Uncharacterized protein n=1 Tax=Desulfosudis oleivorans (strain DSM 6200 / JCM 39069 / Hxd3) TaxID=96561 RepID=A8ZWF2_DESOH|nr:hypothetical protein Dole_0950 [Desulfosudis oleivorans Hxd3]
MQQACGTPAGGTAKEKTFAAGSGFDHLFLRFFLEFLSFFMFFLRLLFPVSVCRQKNHNRVALGLKLKSGHKIPGLVIFFVYKTCGT